MQNVLKVQNILLKYNDDKNNSNGNSYYNNNMRANKIFKINRIMNTKEIKEIKIEKNEKIKAALCNFFSFSFSLGNKNSSLSKTKIDLLFIDFDKFKIWLNTLNSIAKNNEKSAKINILSYKNINSIKKSKIKSNVEKIKKKQSEINFRKIFNYNSWNEKIRAKSNKQNNKTIK